MNRRALFIETAISGGGRAVHRAVAPIRQDERREVVFLLVGIAQLAASARYFDGPLAYKLVLKQFICSAVAPLLELVVACRRPSLIPELELQATVQ